MKRTRNIVIVVAALLIVVIVAVVAARRNTSAAIPVKLQKVGYSDVYRQAAGERRRDESARPSRCRRWWPETSGRSCVKAGSHVSAGELLATIENPTLDYNAAGSQADYNNAVANVSTARIQEQNARVQYQAQVDTNKSALDEARRVYEADVAMFAQKAIARSQVDADKAKLDQAQVAYDQAVQQLKLGAVSGYGMDSVQAAQANAEKSKILNAQNQQQVAFTRIAAPMSGIIQTVAAQTQRRAALAAAGRCRDGRAGALHNRRRQQVTSSRRKSTSKTSSTCASGKRRTSPGKIFPDTSFRVTSRASSRSRKSRPMPRAPRCKCSRRLPSISHPRFSRTA